MSYKFSSTYDSVTDAHIISIEGEIDADEFLQVFLNVFSKDNLIQSTSFLMDIRKLILSGLATDMIDSLKDKFKLNMYNNLDIAILSQRPKENIRIIEASGIEQFINCRIYDNLDECLDFLKAFKAFKANKQ